MEEIKFTPSRYRRFKEDYAIAVKDKKDSFIFDGKEYHTGYAKYLIEYLDSKK